MIGGDSWQWRTSKVWTMPLVMVSPGQSTWFLVFDHPWEGCCMCMSSSGSRDLDEGITNPNLGCRPCVALGWAWSWDTEENVERLVGFIHLMQIGHGIAYTCLILFLYQQYSFLTQQLPLQATTYPSHLRVNASPWKTALREVKFWGIHHFYLGTSISRSFWGLGLPKSPDEFPKTVLEVLYSW